VDGPVRIDQLLLVDRLMRVTIVDVLAYDTYSGLRKSVYACVVRFGRSSSRGRRRLGAQLPGDRRTRH
jgi:hypothetical protein